MNVNSKEKAVLVAGSLLLAALLAIQFVVRPVSARMERDRRAISQGEKDLQTLLKVSGEYRQLKSRMDAVREKIARQKGGPGTLSALEGIEKACGFTRTVEMHPEPPAAVGAYSETKVNIRLESVSWDQVKTLLMKIQSADAPLGVRSMKLTANPKTPAVWNAEIEVISVAPAG